MKICLLTHTMPRFKKDTNSASFISELALGLSSEGHEVIVLTPFDQSFKPYNRGFRVIPYKYIWPEKLHISGYSRVLGSNKEVKPIMILISSLMSFFALINLIYICKKEKVDIITSHWVVPNGFIAFLATRILQIPYTITIPGSDVYLASKRKFFRMTTTIATKYASWVISDSVHYLNQLKALNIKVSRASVIRYGVDVKKLKPEKKNSALLKSLGIEKSDPVILALGRFVEKKGFIYLIDAMPIILKKCKKAKLVLAGNGDLMEAFHKRVQELGLEKSILFPGPVPFDDRGSYYNIADIFAMPSCKDSLGNIDASPVAMMDAMSCGVPVIATKYSGSKDLVNEYTGFIVKPKDARELGLSAIKLLKKIEKYSMKKEVRSIAINNFSLQKTAESYIDIFNEVLRLRS